MSFFTRIRGWVARHDVLCSNLAVLLIASLTFLPLVGKNGFYADDYHAVYGAFTYGPEKILITAWIDRPGAGFTLQWLYMLFGPRIHFYQALELTLNAAAALCAMWIVRKLWPGHKALALGVGVTSVIYPGFTDFMDAFNFVLMLVSYSFYVFSIALTIKVLREKKAVSRVLMSVLAALLALWSVLLNEYYLGLEVLRLAVICLVVYQSSSESSRFKKFGRSLVVYLPYAFTLGGFFIWRFFLFNNQRSGTDLGTFVSLMAGSPFYKLVSLVSGLFKNLLNISVFAWFQPAYTHLNALRLKDLLLIAGLAVLGALVVYFLHRWMHKREESVTLKNKEFLQILLVGLLTVIGTSLPIVFVDREVTFSGYGKYSLSGMLGGILMAAAFLHYVMKPGARSLLVSFMVFSAMLTQLAVGKNMAADWQGSKDLFWQLSWRAPSLKEGTFLTGRSAEYNIVEGFNLWGPVNMMYYPQAKNPVVTADTLNRSLIQTVQMDKDPRRDFRSYILHMESSNLLVLSVPSQYSCLHLIDGRAPDYSSYENSDIQLIGAFSKLDQVDLQAPGANPPEVMFGPEPTHGWCYYYQKGELAQQKGDYAEAARLWDEAQGKGLNAEDKVELLPFIKAFAQLGDENKLNGLLPMFLDNPYHKVSYCRNLSEGNYLISEPARQLLLSKSCVN